jgi:tetratricopeptide (TPR) repeat protein
VSPKNKGKFGKAKVTSVPETDEFISGIDRIMRALKPHAMRLAVFFGVVGVIVVSYTTWNWWQQRKMTGATEIYLRAVALSQVPVEAPEKPDAKDPAKPGEDGDKDAAEKDAEDAESRRPPDPRELPTKFASAEERSRAVLAALEELAADYGSTGVARQALLLQGDALYQLGRFGDAAERYREFADGGGGEEMVLSAREGLAYSLEAKAMAEKDVKARQAGLELALKAFQAMQPQSDGPRADEALYHQARVYTELDKKDDARKLLEQLLADHPDSSLKQDVEMRLPGLRAATAAK